MAEQPSRGGGRDAGDSTRMPKLNILVHKSYHVYNAENVERVRRDVAAAEAAEEETERRTLVADSEARLERLRNKKQGRRKEENEAEKALDRQLKGKGKAVEEENGSRIIRPPTNERMETKGHVNFWAELEAGITPAAAFNPEVALAKAREKEELDSMTKMYLAKKGEGVETGWYASIDGLSDKERKAGVDKTLERAYKDGENKRLSDPLAVMHAFLKRRDDVKSGHVASDRGAAGSSTLRSHERYRLPQSDFDKNKPFEPVVPSLPERRPRYNEREQRPPASASSSSRRPERRADESPANEALSRETSERARAAALIAARRKQSTGSASSVASTPRSEAAWEYSQGQFNREETRAAHLGWAGGRQDSEWASKKRDRDERFKPYGGRRH